MNKEKEAETKIFAVRWARRELKRAMSLDYSKWHRLEGDWGFTVCGLVIPLGLAGTFLPELDDDLKKVTCSKCLCRSEKED